MTWREIATQARPTEELPGKSVVGRQCAFPVESSAVLASDIFFAGSKGAKRISFGASATLLLAAEGLPTAAAGES